MEKTFEELIDEKLTATMDGYVVYTDDIKELLQQVREATITECLEIAFHEDDPVIIWEQIKYLPTEGILTDK